MVKNPNKETEALRLATLFGRMGKLIWVICNGYQLAGSLCCLHKYPRKIIMKIKKKYVFGALGVVAISLGVFLIEILLEALSQYGWYGYLVLTVFVLSTFFYVKYELFRRDSYKIAREVAEKVAKEDIKGNHHEYETRRNLIQEHLYEKINEE